MVDTIVGSPIAGALLTRDYHWWRPAVFSGVRLRCKSVRECCLYQTGRHSGCHNVFRGRRDNGSEPKELGQ